MIRFFIIFLLLTSRLLAADGSGNGTATDLKTWHDLGTTVDGDTYTIIAGTFTLDFYWTITKNVSFVGAGIDQTILTDDVTSTNPTLEVDSDPTGPAHEITGITFKYGTVKTANKTVQSGCPRIKGSTNKIRIHHCKFELLYTKGWVIQDYARPLLDNNTVIQRGGNNFIWIFHSAWDGGALGDKSWSSAVTPGSFDNLYIEYNNFSTDTPANTPGILDTYGGARFVMRYNTFDAVTLPTHGTDDGSGVQRGLRWFEVYGNTWMNLGSKNAFHVRGGTGIFTDNDLGIGASKGITLHYYRGQGNIAHKFQEMISPTYGRAVWDLFDTANDTFGTPGDGIYLTGTAAAGSGLSTLVVSPDPGWTTDEWVGYLIYVPSAASCCSRGFFSAQITENTSDTITFTDSQDGGVEHIIDPGEAFEIHRLLLGLDSTGAGACDVFTRDSSNPVLAVDLNQVRQPVYIWNNITNGAAQGGNATIRGDYHYMLDGLNDGTTGVGSGAIASRPATPSLQYYAWWATDTLVLSVYNVGWSDYWSDPGAHPLVTGEDPTDTTAPTPDPLTFSVAPAAAGPSSVMLTATTASDSTPPILYQARWDETGMTAWNETSEQGNASFTISGLTPNTTYDFQVRARDSAATPNYTAWSATQSAATSATTLPTATATTVNAGTLTIVEP